MPAENARRAATVQVLVIEDDADVRAAIEKRLQAARAFKVHTAEDGERGLRSALELRPDVVLLDIAMPGLGGWGVCRALRSDPDTMDIAIVVMTARWETESEAMAQAFRVERVLFKPLDFGALVETLRAVA